ncbi:transcriptional regulator [Rhizobium sp. S152]|uniref:transcriptional regulator n=1 Tax=Rhizobium sp. S152 TaxID=3055038 RepID=UPI0025A99B3C|nr:transcriptional regulator [Rhizobium sp. S152]MDM9629057.1 transcriptional regulator [Rhizobium sp. S152]
MKKVQRTFTIEYKSGRRKIGAQPSSIWGNVDLKSAARAVEAEGIPFLSPNPLKEASAQDTSVLPDSQRDLTRLVEKAEIPTNGQAMPSAIEAGPVTQVEGPAIVEDVTSSPKQHLLDIVHHEPKPDVAAKASIGTNSARRLNKRLGRTNKFASDDIDQRKTVNRAPKNLRETTVELTSASDARVDLAELETENRRLRVLLAEKLRAENAILRSMLQCN